MNKFLSQIDLTSSDCLDDIKEIISDNPSLLLERPEIFAFLVNKRNFKLLELLEQKSIEFPELCDLKNLSNITVPSKIKVKYFPESDLFDCDNEIGDLFHFKINQNKKEILLKLVSDENKYFELDAVLNQKTLFSFFIEDSQNKTSSISEFLKNKALSFALVSSIAVGVSTTSFINNKILNESPAQSIKGMRNFFSNYSLAVTELEKIQDNKKLFLAINDISPLELDYLGNILEHKDFSHVQENYKDIIVNKIKELIAETQQKRIKFKNQKKVQSLESIEKISNKIIDTSIEHSIDYRILTSIIMQESGFDQGEVSSSGDVALVQINYEIWKPEFDKMKLDLDKEKLQKDEKYALWAMGVILSTIKKRHSDKDPYWFARYHNKNPKRKFGYANLVNSHFTNFNRQQVIDVSEKIDKLLNELKIIDFDKYNNVDSSIVNTLVKDLIKIKIDIENSDIPSNIASN